MAGSRPRIRLEGGGGEPVTLFPGTLDREKSPGPLPQRQAGRRGYGRGYGRVWVDGVLVHPGPVACTQWVAEKEMAPSEKCTADFPLNQLDSKS